MSFLYLKSGLNEYESVGVVDGLSRSIYFMQVSCLKSVMWYFEEGVWYFEEGGVVL